MANILARAIYHEKQEEGSNLCAQHALNSLLQKDYFTAADLGQIASELDREENTHLDQTGRRTTSVNMDDSGFFSVQVLEKALTLWGLSLIRWRSEQMRPFQDKPQCQLAFILNLEQHWFTLRRFGAASTDHETDPGDGHWFNLNSMLKGPEWISKTYLGMFLQQAEADGYSVFVVHQIDPEADLALARTDADQLAITMPNINSSGQLEGERLAATSNFVPSGSGNYDMDEEDFELQAALQASLDQETKVGSTDEWEIPAAASVFGNPSSSSGNMASAAQIAESRRQAEADLARLQREQVGLLEESNIYGGETPPIQAPPSTRPPRRAAPDEEEEEALRRAIEESQRDAEGRNPRHRQDDSDDDIDNNSEYMDVEDDDEHERQMVERVIRERRERERLLAAASRPTPPPPVQPAVARSSIPVLPDIPRLESLGNVEPLSHNGALGFNAAHLDARHYDDEDEMLQAALRASLEDAPTDFRIPENQSTPPILPEARPGALLPASSSASTSQAAVGGFSTSAIKKPVPVRVESESEDEDDDDEEEEEEAPPALSAEEMRRARLARFGG